MIPKKLRFPMRTGFVKFKSLASKLSSPHLTAFIAPSPQLLLAVVVPKKVNKKAVVRNRLRRLLQANLLRDLKDSPHSVVVVFKPRFLEADESTCEMLLSELRGLVSSSLRMGDNANKTYRSTV